jgi:hypothetical protein
LLPILDALDGIYEQALHDAGKEWTAKLRAKMVARRPSGKHYKIVEVDENAPPAERGQPSQRYRVIDNDYQASSDFQPPGYLSGAFYESLGHKVEHGMLIVGQLIPPDGSGDLMGQEIRPLFFRGRNRRDIKEGYSGTIFVGVNAPQTPVRKYSGALEHGFANQHTGELIQRQWWGENMVGYREEIREAIRKRIWDAIRKRTRSTQITQALIIKIYMEKF